MAILTNQPKRKQQIDLNSPEGNAFFLFGMAGKLAEQLGLDEEAILKDMQSSDYEHLIQVFDKHFGDFIDLVR